MGKQLKVPKCVVAAPAAACAVLTCYACCLVPCSVVVCSAYLREYYFSLGDDGAPDERQRQLQRLSQLLSGLGVDIAAEAAERGVTAAADGKGGGQVGADVEAQQVRFVDTWGLQTFDEVPGLLLWNTRAAATNKRQKWQ